MVLRNAIPIAITQLLLLTFLLGCSGTATPTMPTLNNADSIRSNGRVCLGVWRFQIDPKSETIDFAPLRAGAMHMNALTFMEPPAGVLLAVDQVVDFAPGEITVDIALTHPYTGMNFSAAFDICGILIGHGSEHLPWFDELVFAGESQLRLLNPDGYIRWWNPVEFPHNPPRPHQGYIDGLLGTPDDVADFNATLNGFKYFASDLGHPDAPLSDLDTSMRGAFVPGTTCVRRYRIAFTPGDLVFNYAVDANWAPPDGGGGPVVIPDDFPPSANRPEPYRIEIQNLNNTLAYDPDSGTASGAAAMSVYVYDWFGAGDNIVCAFAQNEELAGICTPWPSGGSDTYSIYDIELSPISVASTEDILVWLSVESKYDIGYQGFIPGEMQAVYYQEILTVAEE